MSIFKLFTVPIRMLLNFIHRKDAIMFAPEDDPDMNSAIESARTSLPKFLELLGAPQSGMADFAVKVGLPTSGDGLEHCWVSDLSHDDGILKGKLSVEPNDVEEYRLGSDITVNKDEISDWAYSLDGTFYGHYTTRFLLIQMPKNMRKQVMEIYGWDEEFLKLSGNIETI